MTDTLKNIVNQSLQPSPKQKVVSLISGLDTDAVNKSFQFDSQSQNSLDNLELLRLQVKQLKRQNIFLKRKIDELKSGKGQPKLQTQKKQSLNCINIIKKNALLDVKNHPSQNSLSFIFTEIQNILKSLSSIHRLQINENVWIKYSQYTNSRQNCQEQIAWVKCDQQFKQKIKKKLEMIALQKEQNRYYSLLETFYEFYWSKIQEQKRTKQRIQKYIQKTLQIGKKLIENASIKNSQRSIKSSCIYSIRTYIEQGSAPHNIKGKQNFEYSNTRTHPQRNQTSYSTIQDGKLTRQIEKQKYF